MTGEPSAHPTATARFRRCPSLSSSLPGRPHHGEPFFNTRLGSWGGPTKHPGGLLPRRVPLFLQRAGSWISVELHSDFRMATGTVREVRGTTMNANYGHHSWENRLKILVEPRERLRGPIRRF